MRSAVYGRAARLISIIFAALILSACNSNSTQDVNVANDADVDIGLSGSVGDGPVVGATVKLRDQYGRLLYSELSDSSANYRLRARVKRRDYPLVLDVSDGIDLVTGARPDFELSAVVNLRGGSRTVNLNPLGSFIKKIAEKMPGGLTDANIQVAREVVLDELSFGLDFNTVPDPVGTRIDPNNVATIVRASEALGEMIRRVRDRLIVIGADVNADDVVNVLAADLVDGKIDGRGASGTHERVAAIATLVSAQVLVETMMNQLHVGGTDATGRMDMSINQIMGIREASQLTGSLTLTNAMLLNARVAVDAARNYQDNDQVDTLSSALNVLSAGDSASRAEIILPADSVDLLEGAVASIALASDGNLEVVNSTVRNGGGDTGDDTGDDNTEPPEPPTNSAPTISGSPAGQAVIGEFYDFAPVATDADGDSLSFSIENRPGWLSFDTVSGRLSGIPDVNDVQVWSAIRITVSDGSESSQLGPFDINVLDEPNAIPSIGGSPATSATVGEFYLFQPVASDGDNDPLTFSISNMPAWANFNTGTGRLWGVPTLSDAGNSGPIIITVSDGKVDVSLDAFSINVSGGANGTPEISGSPATAITAGQFYSFQPSASDPDGDSLTFSVSNLPTWASFSSTSGRLFGTPDDSDIRTWSGIQITVSDGQDSASLSSFSIEVQAIPVTAKDVAVSWTAPTHNIDGTLLTDLTGFKVYYGRVNQTATQTRDINNPSSTSYVLQDLAAGDWRFRLTAVNSAGLESDLSAEAVVSIN